MAIALDPSSPIDVIIEEDKELPEEQRTIFQILPFSFSEFLRFQDLTDNEEGKNRLDEIYKILDSKLVGWKNLKTASGVVVPFDKEKKFDFLDIRTVTGIFAATVEANLPSEEEEKN